MRYFLPVAKDRLCILYNVIKSDIVRDWLVKLEEYFLSDEFTDISSLVYSPDDTNIGVKISNNVLFKYYNILQWLEDNVEVTQCTVAETNKLYEDYMVKQTSNHVRELLLECDNNYAWYRLSDRAGLQYESLKMGHCIGSEKHVYDILHGPYSVLSLRQNDEPYVTVKYSLISNFITDTIGRDNLPVSDEFMPYIHAIMNFLHLENVETLERA